MLGWGLLAAALGAGSRSLLLMAAARGERMAAAPVEALLTAACALVFAAHALAQLQWESLGFPGGVLAPSGSFLTRICFDISPDLRRGLEPSLWLLGGAVVLLAAMAPNRPCRWLFTLAAIGLLVNLTCSGLVRGMVRDQLPRFVRSGEPQLSTFVVVATLLGFGAMHFHRIDRARRLHVREIFSAVVRSLLCASLAVTVTLFGSRLLAQRGEAATEGTLRVGVHYYSWFPENWGAGHVGRELRPPVLPELGEYQSDGKGVFAQHVSWMKAAGIDLIVFDWWPKRRGARNRILDNIESLGTGDPHFTVQYEPHDLKERTDFRFAGEDDHTVVMTSERAERMVVHWRHLAKQYLAHPQYLRIDGRPVIFLYLSRHLVGDVAGALRLAKEAVAAEIGVLPYVVGDEVYFNVLDYSERRGVYLRPEGSPNWQRLAALDAITCYNGFQASRTEHGGSRGADRYFSDMEALYARYRAAAAAFGIPFFPGVMPGYNDRGVRLNVDHMIFPRKITDGASGSERSFFQEGLARLIAPFLDRRRPMLLVTSWNEWNEGSQIEPSTVSPPSVEDSSGNGVYTLGERHSGYGKEALEELRRFIPQRR